ncbi:hypothetical protein T484DRAFT_1985881 [Baffinella frigidus]|nr:hypothetical protein T484DRAFT_1985881 [Cryptophyta sp. CCMP2293]|mmetsp:Transcript_44326/g.105586  ORF Transcript_44326/g.105586 Transcript_44326/m.105586 type:complete len:289 (+) Transcript_44326:80-946(+)
MTGQHGRQLPTVRPSATRCDPPRRGPFCHAHSKKAVTAAPCQVARPSSALPNLRQQMDPRGHLQEILDLQAPRDDIRGQDLQQSSPEGAKASFHAAASFRGSASWHSSRKASFHASATCHASGAKSLLDILHDIPSDVPRSDERRTPPTRMSRILHGSSSPHFRNSVPNFRSNIGTPPAGSASSYSRDILETNDTCDSPLARLPRSPKGGQSNFPAMAPAMVPASGMVPISSIPARMRIRIVWEPSHVAFAQRYFPERSEGASSPPLGESRNRNHLQPARASKLCVEG